ncbi:hypothetical protein BH23ACT11_BH23ACT11_18150 [soil metagenome]
MGAPAKLHDLVERFDRNLDAYKSGDYNETQARGDFIDPLMSLLGWDVHNRKGKTPAYRDVIEEDRVKVGGGTKAPDYGFYAGGTRRFFLEAKKPSVDIAGDLAPAVQLRRYAWSAKLPLSILTDFEEFAVYDCRYEPVKDDRPANARLDLITFDQYPDRWDDIQELFSRDAVLDGSLEKYAEAHRKKRGTETVDAAFLREIEGWRDALARDLAARNGLNTRQLNFAVQMTIDRLIFLRMAEDRGIEDYGKLLGLTNGTGVYGRLVQQFRDADDRYNSGLFHFRNERGRGGEPDELTPNLKIDDGELAGIVRGLYYPESPYEFSVLPVDVLGQVYEQFLGSVIHLADDGHTAVVEQKPEVRKAGGVYYTPTYIVDYIVENTVGKLLEGKKPGPRGGVSKLKVVDPACGSGSFLIGAYEYLLDWHRDRYLEDGPEKWSKQLYEGPGGLWHLTIEEKKRILLNNIHGVDIDPQAVEVTKLSLLIKVLEGESEQSLQTQLRMFQERALPDLRENVKCGNSLIGPDFYAQQDMALFEEEDHYRINVFDWQAAFPQVFDGVNPGFDAVIGNPPYGIVFDNYAKDYLEKHYSAFIRNNDNYAAFSQKAVELLSADGLFGFIIPNTFLIGPYFDNLKRQILAMANVEQIVDFGLNQVFPAPNVFTALLILRRKTLKENYAEIFAEFTKVSDLEDFSHSLDVKLLNQATLESLRWSPDDSLITRTLQNTSALDQLAWVKDVGLNYWTKGRGKIRGGSIASRVLYKGDSQNPDDKPYLKGRNVSRYFIGFGDQWLRHDYQAYLDPDVDTMRFSPEFLNREKIIYRQTADRVIAAIDTDKMLTDKTLHTIVAKDEWQNELNLHYLLGILNSNLMNYLYQILAQEEGRTFAQVKVFRMKQLPIRTIDFSDPEDAARHETLVGLVGRMLELHEKLAEARIERERTVIGHQISATDRQIDNLVYELYGLTDEEIRIVEDATR